MKRRVVHALAVIAAASAITAAATGVAQVAPSPPAATPDAVAAQAAWARVRAALTPQQQAYEVRRFANGLRAGGGSPAVQMDVRDIASGRAVPLDDPAVLQRPQAHQVTVVLDGRFYDFRPLSRASLEPLLGR